jgi:hypothetical protein
MFVGRPKSESPGFLFHACGLWWPLVLIGLTWPMLSGQIPAFRDTLHFYWPLWSWIDSLPLFEQLFPWWSPWDASGLNLAGEGSSLLFYPPRWLVLGWLPMPLATRLGVFLLGHALLAYLLSYAVARRWGLRPLPAWTAAICYAGSCPVLFQIYNPIYLVGAAWLPLALGGGLWSLWCLSVTATCRPVSDARGDRSGWRWGLAAAAALAAIVLGGDPQLAYHVLLLGGLWWLLLGATLCLPHSPIDRRRWLRCALDWALLSLLGLGLAAVQLLPSWHWIDLSDRHQALSAAQRLHFSLPPWQLLTWISPNLLGSYTGPNTRWVSAWLPDGRSWVPSLYAGAVALPLVLVALCRLRHVRRRMQGGGVGVGEQAGDWSVWAATLVALWSLLASQGEYSLGFWKDWLLPAAWQPGWLRGVPREAGSLYRWMADWLPMYANFRYPSKWTVVVAWALAMLVGVGASRCGTFLAVPGRGRWPTRWAAGLMVVASAVLGLGGWLRQIAAEPPAWHQRAIVDSWWGELDLRATASLLIVSGLHTLVIAIGLLLWNRWRLAQAPEEPRCSDTPVGVARRSERGGAAGRAGQRLGRQGLAHLWLLLLSLDLGLAARAWLVWVDPECLQIPGVAASMAADGWQTPLKPRWFRSSVGPLEAARWSAEQPLSLCQVVAAQRDQLVGKLHLLGPLPHLTAQASIRPARVGAWIELLQRLDRESSGQPAADTDTDTDTDLSPVDRLFRRLGLASWRLVPRPLSPIDTSDRLPPVSYRVVRPLFWDQLAGDASCDHELEMPDAAAVQRLVDCWLANPDEVDVAAVRRSDWDSLPVGLLQGSRFFEGSEPSTSPEAIARWQVSAPWRYTLSWSRPIDRDMCIELPWLQDGGWEARLSGTRGDERWELAQRPIDCNRLHQLVAVPKGTEQIRFRYLPPGVRLGGGISSLTALVLLLGAWWLTAARGCSVAHATKTGASH